MIFTACHGVCRVSAILRTRDFTAKHGRGWLFDTKFLLQYRDLIKANSVGSLCLSSDNIALLNELFQPGHFTDTQLRLATIYQHFYRLLHQQIVRQCCDEIPVVKATNGAARMVQC